MTTFCRYFTDNKALQKETENPYYEAREKEQICDKILEEFDLDKDKGHIINGHTPVKELHGEKPVKANGKLFVIDGGISAAYQRKTGTAGYTLTYNSYEMRLIYHKPFISKDIAVMEGNDSVSSNRIVKFVGKKKIADTDIGDKLESKVDNLTQLLKAYNKGIIKEKY